MPPALPLFLALFFLSSDPRPPLSDLERFPSVAECQQQRGLANRWVADLEHQTSLSPSRAGMVAPDLAIARQYQHWWHTAWIARCPAWIDADRTRLAELRHMLGAERYADGDWPWIEGVK